MSRRRQRSQAGARGQARPAPVEPERLTGEPLAAERLDDEALEDEAFADEPLEEATVADERLAAEAGPDGAEETAGFGSRLLAGFAERPAAHWLIEVHLAVLLGLGIWPLLKMGYERLANITLEHWMTSSAGLGLAVFALVLAFVLIELIVRGLGLVNVLDIAGREYALYYVSPIAYVLGALFLFVVGFVFWLNFQQLAQSGPFGAQPPSLRDVQSFMGTILLFILPGWTMRLLADEQRQGTIELLLTSPVRDGEVVIGKYLGALSLLLDTLALTLLYPLILFNLGNPDPGPIIGGYVGLVLFGAALLAIGLFSSALTENQVIAFVISFAIYLAFLLLNAAASVANFIQADALREALNSLNIFEHLDSFTRGLIDSYSLVFFLSLIAVWLFLAMRVLETRRWR